MSCFERENFGYTNHSAKIELLRRNEILLWIVSAASPPKPNKKQSINYKKAVNSLKHKKMNFLDFFFPNRCLECNRIINGNEVVCELCYSKINFTHYLFDDKNELSQAAKLLFPVEKSFALFIFEKDSLSRKIVHELKYKKRQKVGKILANWTNERLDFKNDKPDLIVTVPLHPRKQNERGYNQLHRFADTISEHFQIPCNHKLLKRNKSTKAQALKNKLRRAQTENLFSVTETVENKHILLVDDVYTTGNTISTVAWEILKNGKNNRISLLIIAMDS